MQAVQKGVHPPQDVRRAPEERPQCRAGKDGSDQTEEI